MATSDTIFAREVAKFASRLTYGIIKRVPEEQELLYLLNKQMILTVLGDSVCLEELTVDEEDTLEGAIILKS